MIKNNSERVLETLDYISNVLSNVPLLARDNVLEDNKVINRFKNIVIDDLSDIMSDIESEDYEYAHEAILMDVQSLGLFQFRIHYDPDIEKNMYEQYGETMEIAFSDIANTHSSRIEYVSRDYVLLVSSYLACEFNIDINFKLEMLKFLNYILETYLYFNRSDAISEAYYNIYKKLLSLGDLQK